MSSKGDCRRILLLSVYSPKDRGSAALSRIIAIYRRQLYMKARAWSRTIQISTSRVCATRNYVCRAYCYTTLINSWSVAHTIPHVDSFLPCSPPHATRNRHAIVILKFLEAIERLVLKCDYFPHRVLYSCFVYIVDWFANVTNAEDTRIQNLSKV